MSHNITTDTLPGSHIYFHTPTAVAKNNLLYPICMGDFFCDNNYLIARDHFDSFLLIYVEEGSGFIEKSGKEILIRKNDIIFLDCYLPHRYGTHSNMRIKWLHFDGFSARTFFSFYSEKSENPFHISSTDSRSLSLSWNSLYKILCGEEKSNEFWISKYITDLLTNLITLISKHPKDTHLRISAQVIDYLQQHYQEFITIDDIARRFSLNTSYLIRKFKKETGMTPYQYLTTIRMDHARYALTTTHHTVLEISELCGYQSENSFCITFRKETGYTPTQYRYKHEL